MIFTWAPDTRAPAGSVTSPTMLPRSTCAKHAFGNGEEQTKERRTNRHNRQLTRTGLSDITHHVSDFTDARHVAQDLHQVVPAVSTKFGSWHDRGTTVDPVFTRNTYLRIRIFELSYGRGLNGRGIVHAELFILFCSLLFALVAVERRKRGSKISTTRPSLYLRRIPMMMSSVQAGPSLF